MNVGETVSVSVEVGKNDGVTVSVSVEVSVSLEVWVNVGDPVSVSVGCRVNVSVAMGASTQLGPNIVFPFSDTAPVWARARPFILAPVFKVIETKARIFPSNEVLVSKVAELPTCHQTLQGFPPVTDEPDEVSNVDAALNIHTPEPIRFKFPLSEKLLVEQ
jgi:hypothetical protein